MHGDEALGRQMLLALADWLCARGGVGSGGGKAAIDPLAARLLSEAHLYLIPSMNPDGFAAK